MGNGLAALGGRNANYVRVAALGLREYTAAAKTYASTSPAITGAEYPESGSSNAAATAALMNATLYSTSYSVKARPRTSSSVSR